MSPNNPFLDKFSVDFIEDDDNETVIDFDYREDNEVFDDVNQIEKVCTEDNEDIEDNDKTDSDHTSVNETESESEMITNCVNDDLLMGSQLLANKYRKNQQNSDSSDVHKKCKIQKNKEKEMRVELQMELELERQHRIRFQKQLEEHMSYSLRKEFEDCKQIKSLKLELLKCKQQLKTLKKSLKTDNNCNDFDNNSDQSNHKSDKDLNSCSDCNLVMKSEASMILHLINHCVEEEEFQLETQTFRLDEFTDSMIDSIRKSVSYCCPRCNLTFNCLEIYYHIYKCHTNEKPIVCNRCKLYATHLDYWHRHNQSLHKGALQSVSYVDIGQYNRLTERLSNALSHSNGTKSGHNYRPYSTHNRRTRATPSYESKSMSDKSDSPEVIQISDSPPHQSPITYRPILSNYSKPTLAGKTLIGTNEFECDFPDCDFKTTSKDKLTFHTSAHTNSKFKCPYCPYVGNILNDIIRHITKSKKHDGLKVYECRECSYGTNCLSSFKEHLTNKHLDDSEDEDVNEYISDMFRNEHSTNDDKSDS